MSKRQQRTIGAILKIDLRDGNFNYAQILKQDIVFYDIHTTEELIDLKILNEKGVLFFLGVYNDIITKGRWEKVGKLPVRKEFELTPNKFIQDNLNPDKFQLYITNTGDITPATKEECLGLERAAVWEASHVEERIKDHYAGRPNIWVERLGIK